MSILASLSLHLCSPAAILLIKKKDAYWRPILLVEMTRV